MDITITHDESNQKFSAIIAGQEALLQYEMMPDKKTLDYHHTYVPPELRGQHIADKIVKYALDYAQAKHYKVIPSCSFVQRFIDRHPEYQALLNA